MAIVSPRLSLILQILLSADAPISVKTLSKTIGSSQRTIFRELENVDSLLRDFDLSLKTKIGQGLSLVGTDYAFQTLLDFLEDRGKNVPQNKHDRQTLLLYLLLDTEELQKLFYFSDALAVSEATISLDLDQLAPRLSSHHIELQRRQGQGISVSGNEEDKRRLLVDLLYRMPEVSAFMAQYGYMGRKTQWEALEHLFQENWLPQLEWMTEESLKILKLQLYIMIDRVQNQHRLPAHQVPAVGMPRQLAAQLCDSLESEFSISLSEAERDTVGTMIRACRAKQLNPLDINDTAAYSRIQNLVYRMIDRFDDKLSHSLKLNEDLVRGLTLHLWSAIVRLQKGMDQKSEMQEQLKQNFPDLFHKSSRAVTVLEEELQVKVPESEVAFIASHFGAALMHLGEGSSRKLVLKAGIICVSGIGVSYMMASQVRKKFQGLMEVVVGDWSSPEEWENYDLLISSFPLEYKNCPVTVVSPILSQEDFMAIQDIVENFPVRHSYEPLHIKGSLAMQLENTALHFADVSKLLSNFSHLSLPAECSFDEVIKKVGYRFGSRLESGNRIYLDLLQREAVSSQVIPQLEIALLHTRSQGVVHPVIALISSEEGQFHDEYFKGIKAMLVMLAPRDSGKTILELFGHISSALLEGELLSAVQAGDAAAVYSSIENTVYQYIQEYLHVQFGMQ